MLYSRLQLVLMNPEVFTTDGLAHKKFFHEVI